MQVEAYIVTSDRVLAPVEASEMSDGWFLDDTVRWIKITSATPQEIERALAPLQLDPRIMHHCAHPQPPQIEALEKVLFMVMPLWTPDAAAVSAVCFVAVAKTLITIQDAPVAVLDQQAERLRGEQRLYDPGIAALTLDLARAMLASLRSHYLTLRNDVETTAEVLERRPGDMGADDLLTLKRRATRLANILEDYLFCLVGLGEARSETLRFDAVRTAYGELVRDVQSAQRLIARIEDRIRDLRQSSSNYVQESTNRRLNVLAVLSAIYLPATLIAGIYGMNFDNIPIMQLPYGYVIVLALMIGLVVGQIWFFYRRGYFR